MRTIVIKRSVLPIRPACLSTWVEVNGQATQRIDYLGQILQGLGHAVESDKVKKPVLASDLNLAVPPFTRLVRGKSVQTDLASDIMQLPHSPESERRLAAMLLPHGFQVEFVQ